MKTKPPRDYVSARLRLFSLLVCIANFYGFAEPKNADAEMDDMFNETAISYLQRAINLKPALASAAESARTLGYTYFCMAAIKGLRAHKLQSNKSAGRQKTDLLAKTLIREALLDIRMAERNRHFPPYQYHLKGFLLYDDENFEAAAAAWVTAARDYRPPSPRMYYNAACAFSKAKRYTCALNELETAVLLDDSLDKIIRTRSQADPDFEELRKTQAEFAQSNAGVQNLQNPPKSQAKRTFAEIVG